MLPGSADNPELKILGRRRDASLANLRKPSEDRAIHDNKENIDFAKLDDSALLALRAQMRTRLERLAPHSVAHAELSARYDLSTQEIDDRARRAWSQAR